MQASVRWASGGIRNASRTYSNALYGKRHNEKALTHGNAFTRSAVRGAHILGSIACSLCDPAMALGTSLAGIELIGSSIGALVKGGPMPFIQYRGGGYVIRNSQMMANGRAYVMGPYAHVGRKDGWGVIQHEIGHIKQYNKWGGWRYFTTSIWDRTIKARQWMEHNADAISGQSNYPPKNDYLMYYAGYTFANQMGWLGLFGNVFDYFLIEQTGIWLLGFVY